MNNSAYTDSLNDLIEQFAKLPGIGPKTAERLAFYILKAEPEDALALARAVSNVKQNIRQIMKEWIPSKIIIKLESNP